MSRRGSLVLGVAGIALAALTFVGPWWTITWNVEVLGVRVETSTVYRLFGVDTVVKSPVGSSNQSTDYSDLPNIRSVFLVGMIFTGLGLAFGILSLVVSAMSASRPRSLRMASALSGIAFLTLLLALLYVTFSLPSAVNADSGLAGTQLAVSGFWGTSSNWIPGVQSTASWGGGWAWYAGLVALATFLMSAMASARGAPQRIPLAS